MVAKARLKNSGYPIVFQQLRIGFMPFPRALARTEQQSPKGFQLISRISFSTTITITLSASHSKRGGGGVCGAIADQLQNNLITGNTKMSNLTMYDCITEMDIHDEFTRFVLRAH